jgi:membrane protease YdiL (CAAX protease family)
MGADLTSPPDPIERRAWLVAAAVVTFAYFWLAEEIARLTWPMLSREMHHSIGFANWYGVGELVFGLILTLPTWRTSGFRIGDIRGYWLGVLIVCGSSIGLAAIISPLTSRPFAGRSLEVWLLSAPAQELVFMGFLYGRFERLYPGFVHPNLRVRWGLVVTAVFFAAWHLHNFGAFASSFVEFQLAYTFVGCIWVGLARQWTGSILYGVLVHMAVNFIASRPAS